MLSRRNALTILGLSSASGSAFATEDMIPINPKREALPVRPSADLMIAALRNLAAEIETHGVLVTNINVNSTITGHDVVTQTLTLDFVIQNDTKKEGA